MKKFLMTLALVVILTSTCFAAQSVNVCDFTLKVFAENYNHILVTKDWSKDLEVDDTVVLHHEPEKKHSIFKFTGIPENEPPVSPSTLDRSHGDQTVAIPLKNFSDGKGNIIELVLNHKATISAINLKNNVENRLDEMEKSLQLTLFSIGLTQNEISSIVNELKNSGSVEKFLSSIDKTLKIEGDALKNNGVGEIKIEAYVK